MADEQERIYQEAIERLNQQFAEIAKQQQHWLAEALAPLAEQSQQMMAEALAPVLERVQIATESATRLADQMSLAIYETMSSGISKILSAYAAQHVFIRCPDCGRHYAISDPNLERADLFECYQQCRGKECWVQCDQILPQEYAEKLQVALRENEKPPCTHRFTLHEGLVEHKAETAMEWFSRGPYTHTAEGVVDLKIGQAIQPNLPIEFSWIDCVILVPRQTRSGALVKTQWYRTGPKRNEFVILTSTEHEEDIGKPTRVSWHAVGLRQLPKDQEVEPWRRFLISSARTLLYKHDPRMSVLESWMAFGLFLEKFIEDNWKSPHVKENLTHLRHVAGRSSVTDVRVLLHEALGVHFVNSEVWEDWNWARSFRNQVAHGRRLQDTEYKEYNKKARKIGTKFRNEQEIAKFCYRSVVRAIYFIRYWK